MHYTCSSCKGTSEMEGACQTAGCANNGQPLMSCDCGDASSHKMEEMGGGDAPAMEETPVEGGDMPMEGGDTPAEEGGDEPAV